MSYEMEFEGLEELIKMTDKLATESELEASNKKILDKCGELAYKTVKPLIRRSSDNSKSGRKGNRPPGHAADNVPKPRLRRKNGKLYTVIGWEKSDNTPYYYEKFEEWGSSQRPPYHSFGLVNKLLRKSYDSIALKEYNKIIERLEK